ncbi:MAG: hypothetical protein K2K38_00170 [Clostridia bacterium]|nr:hypothetical protein [Clostridia bacterium]
MALEVNNLEGNEVADDYIRKSVPQGRWSDTWGVFKSNFLKLILINVFVLITFAPGIALMFFRSAYIKTLGNVYPFNSSILFPYYTDVTGLAERLTLSADILFYATLFIAGFIASIGIAGATYSIRKLINTHGEFSIKGFFHGVKVNYFNTLLPVIVFLMFLYATFLIGDQMDYAKAMGGGAAGEITAYVFIIIATVLVGIFFAWVYAVGTTYKVKFTHLFKNSFVLCIGSILRTVFMAGFSLIPVWLFIIGGVVRIISYVIFIFIGFSFIIMCWTAFTQSVFDAFINPTLKAAEEEKKAARTQEEVVADEKQRARELLAAGKSELIARPIMPIASEAAVSNIGKNFTRKDISAVASGREKLNSDVVAYENAHKNDTVYVEYNRLFAEREKALSDEVDKKGKKKKKISAANLLK